MHYNPSGCSVHGTSHNTGAGCHFLLQGDLSEPGMDPGSPALASGFFFTTEPSGKPQYGNVKCKRTVSQDLYNTGPQQSCFKSSSTQEWEQGKEKNLLTHLAAVSLKQICASVSGQRHRPWPRPHTDALAAQLCGKKAVPHTRVSKDSTLGSMGTHDGCPNWEGHKFPRGWCS